jgi:hypothetical protein
VKRGISLAHEDLVCDVIEECLRALEQASEEHAGIISDLQMFKKEISAELEDEDEVLQAEQQDQYAQDRCCRVSVSEESIAGPQGTDALATMPKRSRKCPGVCCIPGPQGKQGPVGPRGPTGPSGGLTSFGNFYALMPPDNPTGIGQFQAVAFPTPGPCAGVVAYSNSEFVLPDAGVYEITWQVSVDEEGQLELWLDSGTGPYPLPQTVVGRRTGNCQIVGDTLIATNVMNSIVSVRNPNNTVLTLPPYAGGGFTGTVPVSATITIKQIN